MHYSKRIITALFLVCGFVAVAQGQPKRAVADKIVAVVGDRIILQSEIRNSILDMQRQGTNLPDSAECMLTQQAVISKVLMLQAEKDSLPVTDEEVEAELDQRIRYFVNQVGTIEELENMAGKTVYQIKDDARESVKERKLAEAMQRKILENVRITPVEVKAFFDKIPTDSLPFYESELEIGQIVLFPKPSRDIELYVVSELNNYKKQIESKVTTFCELVKGTDDPGSKERCGRYELNRNEKIWDPTFMSTAFRLKEGEISSPIKSKMGYHIIEMEQRNGDNAIVRHILKIPPVTEDEIRQSIQKLDSIRSKVVATPEKFNEIAIRSTEDDIAKFAGPFVMSRDGDTYVTIDELDKDMVGMLSKMNVGDFSQPTPFINEQGKKGVRVLYLKSRSEPHRMNMRDDYSRISNFALEEKKSKTLDKWIKNAIPTYYIMVDNTSAAECPLLQKYNSSSTAGY